MTPLYKAHVSFYPGDPAILVEFKKQIPEPLFYINSYQEIRIGPLQKHHYPLVMDVIRKVNKMYSSVIFTLDWSHLNGPSILHVQFISGVPIRRSVQRQW